MHQTLWLKWERRAFFRASNRSRSRFSGKLRRITMLHRKTMSSAPVQRRMAAQRTSFAQGPNPSRSMSRASRGVHVSAALLDVAQLKVSLKSVSARLPSMVATALRRAVDPKADLRQQEARQAIIEFYTDLRRDKAEQRMAEDFSMYEAGHERKFTRNDYLSLLYDIVLPSVPDFTWSHASTYELDSDGFMLVTVQATGHHTGKALCLPGLAPLAPSGRHFCLEEEAQMVRIQDGKVKEIKVFPVRGAGPRAMYAALGGELPPQMPHLAPAQEEAMPVP